MPQHTHAPRQGGIRRGPRRADNFTILSNIVLDDDRLSYRARGLLVWLLSKPADWHIRSESIARHSPREGRDAIRSAMRELVEAGYLVVEKFQDERGCWITVQTIHEEPVDSSPPPTPGKPPAGSPDVGQPGALTSTDLPRTKTHNNVVVSHKLEELESATTAAGLTASYARIKPQQKAEILDLIDVHGVESLVVAAKTAHRQLNPTLHVHGWLRLWRALPIPRRPLPPPCDDCDEYGWLGDDAHGRAVRCACRRPAAA